MGLEPFVFLQSWEDEATAIKQTWDPASSSTRSLAKARLIWADEWIVPAVRP